ncbi:MAG: ATP-dependent Clp protease adaptor ClpS [Phycisphaeraceae bacterium]|nr:ATP-dependent Clp protease adaptor ClpS [Phycisphaeraceae bacterium]
MSRQADEPEREEQARKRQIAKNLAAARESAASQPGKLDRLPPFNLLLLHDNAHDARFVIRAITDSTPLDADEAKSVMHEASARGRAVVLVAHFERAEFYRERLRARGLSSTVEPAA